MSDYAAFAKFATTKLPTAIQQINYPIHKGLPNPAHGKFIFVGSIPGVCYDHIKKCSFRYDTEQEAINAALEAGVTHLQGVDCRKIVWGK
jgi:hypothetical protein